MSGGGAGGKGAMVAAAPVPVGSRKLVQGLKEIVNLTEAEIYAAPRECGMDAAASSPKIVVLDVEVFVVLDVGAVSGVTNVHYSFRVSRFPANAISDVLKNVCFGFMDMFWLAELMALLAIYFPRVPLQTNIWLLMDQYHCNHRLGFSMVVDLGYLGKASSKPVVTADRGYAGQYPSLPNTNQNLKQSVSMVPPTELDKGLQPAQDSVQVKNHGHSAADSNLPYGTDWSPQDDPTSLPGDPSFTFAMRPAPASERHLEPSDGISEYNDGMLNNSSSYQPHNYSYTEQEECVSLSFGSFGSGAFSGLLPRKATDRNVEFPAREESAPVDQIDARNQDYYESGAVTSQADENLEAMLGANMENVDAPSVSQANELRQAVLDPSGLQYDVPSVSSHAYSNTNASQPSTMEDPQGNNQAHTLSHLSNLMIKEVPETRYRSENSSTNRGLRSSADRGGQSNSVHSSSTDNMTSRPPVSGSGTTSVRGKQLQGRQT
ncbi:unnamed protein product [Miscanthus lutarioriparius]|uniref:GBF-interacting protein 1 N-terminal domain-containing protein n=1 Tax=Miscanthus lutarioriparius TaxID=422564 RepID=A0A811QRB7_9POAL|nr:unnamed protein product [Miscanthus lutarioriparius]